MKDVLLETCKKENLYNVRYLGAFGIAEAAALVNLCDVSLVTFANIPILYTNSPNKLFDSLSAGKPIIVNSKGWTKTMVETHHGGRYVDPELPTDFVAKILELKKDPEPLALMGVNAMKLAESTYDKAILCDQFAGVVHGLLLNKD